jgi:hypothetical protein
VSLPSTTRVCEARLSRRKELAINLLRWLRAAWSLRLLWTCLVAMRIARVRLDQYLAYRGFALSFLFLLAVVALAVSGETFIRNLPHSRPVGEPK